MDRLEHKEATTCRVHILDPSRPYYVATWTIGEHVSRELYDRFKDTAGELYLLVYYQDDKPQMNLSPRELWYKAKDAVDQQGQGAQANVTGGGK